MAMMEALKTDAFYVGAMGSLITSNKRRERLTELDLNAEQIEKLHAPIGFDIHSRTPYEIAVSIAAHLISARAKR
jgi:xanthine dehydrogenase accessory factor